jgi:tetratricopeptide (TPR) repeat protein
MALIGKGRLAEADKELALLKKIVADPSLKSQVTFSNNTGYAILRIAPEVIAGELAARRRQWDAALLHLERGVRYEDSLIYQEPADWHSPVRHSLGAVLLKAGRPDEAEAVYWQDLKINAENGWSLHGLMLALEAQGKKDGAALVRKRFEKVWKDADFPLSPVRTGTH